MQQLVTEDFEDYYSSNPAQDFAAQVFTNNAYVAAQSILFGVLLGIPVLYVLLLNAVNVGVAGGLMAANDRTGLFFGLILPHGLLELTAVFVACGLGLKLGWTVVDPGPRTRAQALAEEGRALVVRRARAGARAVRHRPDRGVRDPVAAADVGARRHRRRRRAAVPGVGLRPRPPRPPRRPYRATCAATCAASRPAAA